MASICDVLKDCNLVDSKSAARRLIQQGSIEVNGNRVFDIDMELDTSQMHSLKVGGNEFILERCQANSLKLTKVIKQ